jgi:hypothetical protein
MSRRPGRGAVGRIGITVLGVSLALLAAGVANAGTGSPTSIHVVSQSGLTVEVSGNWSWPEEATASVLSYAGYAIDWGDVTSGNQLGSYHIGDGTAATNVVLQPTSPAQGASGTWGPLSHTYAQPGDYTVCAIMYDLGESLPFKTTGYQGLKATGTSHNTDNSVEQNNEPSVACTTVSVTVASQTAFESFQGFTAAPTGTADSTPTGNGSPFLPLLLLAGSGLTSVLVFGRVKTRR